jgi:hypothetical protein
MDGEERRRPAGRDGSVLLPDRSNGNGKQREIHEPEEDAIAQVTTSSLMQTQSAADHAVALFFVRQLFTHSLLSFEMTFR